jgi:hypothetical protein
MGGYYAGEEATMKYSMLVQWSEEDQCYLVIAPE